MFIHSARLPLLVLALMMPLMVTGCFSQPASFTGKPFPPTESVQVSFQESSVPRSCQGFAHLLISTAGPTTGRDIELALIREARAKGADQILIGMARERLGKRQETFQFDYYGPEYPYPFPQGWMGWKFGFEKWEKAGPLMGFGLNTWGSLQANYDSSLIMQAAFLRCH